MSKRRQKGYLVIGNQLLEDASKKMSDKGLLLSLLSNSETYEVSVAGMLQACTDGKSAVAAAKNRNIENGHITVIRIDQYHYHYIVREIAETDSSVINDQIEQAKRIHGSYRAENTKPIVSTIIREEHHENYTVLDTEALRDERLSLAAKFLFALICKHKGQPGYHYTDAALARECGVEEKTVAHYMQELVSLGYIVKKTQAKTKDGKFGHITWEIHPYPGKAEAKVEQSNYTPTPSCQNQTSENACTANQPQRKTLSPNDNNNHVSKDSDSLSLSSFGSSDASTSAKAPKKRTRRIDHTLVLEVKKQIAYDDLVQIYDSAILDTVVTVMARVYADNYSDLPRILREKYAGADVVTEYRKLTPEHIGTLVEAICRVKNEIKATHRYVARALFDAKRNHETNLRISNRNAACSARNDNTGISTSSFDATEFFEIAMQKTIAAIESTVTIEERKSDAVSQTQDVEAETGNTQYAEDTFSKKCPCESIAQNARAVTSVRTENIEIGGSAAAIYRRRSICQQAPVKATQNFEERRAEIIKALSAEGERTL